MKKKSLLLTAVATLGLTAATMAQNVPNYVPTNGLVGWWPFNGNANDESGNGNNGTVNGATLTQDRFGNTNSAFNFNGVNNYISIQADSLPVSTRTISVWFYSTNIGQGQLGRAVLGYGGLSCTQGRGWLMILDNPGQPNKRPHYH